MIPFSEQEQTVSAMETITQMFGIFPQIRLITPQIKVP
jgi:hypothetical protein